MVNRPFRAEIGAGSPETVCEMVSSLPPEETAQNAALIAAAPELLEALELFLRMDWRIGPENHEYDIARAAVAKAKGGQ